jgi:hypothetical protein
LNDHLLRHRFGTTTTTINNVNQDLMAAGVGGSSVVSATPPPTMAGSSSNIYRADTDLTNNQRLISRRGDINTTCLGLAPLARQTGTLVRPMGVPVILGQQGKPGANGNSPWQAPRSHSSTSYPDLPFVIEGQTSGGPSISLAKTVGTTPASAQARRHHVPAGTVYYCYT